MVESHAAFQLLSDILEAVSSRTAKTVVALVLLICVLCPILELFDHWDHTAQTGNDTEYTFVAVGLCVGAAYACAGSVLSSQVVDAVSKIVSQFSASKPLAAGRINSFFVVPIPLSPPVLALRI